MTMARIWVTLRLMTRGRGRDTERRSWHGMNQPKPRLPYYLRPSKRLRSLDEFEPPAWKGRVRFDGDDEVTFGGVVREMVGFFIMFAIAAVIVVSAWRWLYGAQTCVEIVRGFKVGWC